ncbi:unnamed protein product [Prorocentrum cordatum]|uniref:Uncharacterized protein n=1 Tax=Prorocentrum cordatum TaxID=2364126 RepID=A0ABN9XTI9_9DINO|nr:unnamed protein product [Polarella glacialis]
MSRGTRQRLCRRQSEEREVDRALWGLNSLFTHQPQPRDRASPGKGPERGAECGSYHLFSAGQAGVLDRVRRAVRDLGPPPVGASPAEALRKLRVASWYDVDSTTLGRYSLADVSLPSGDVRPVPVSELWVEGGCQMVEDFCRLNVVPPEQSRARLRSSGVVTPYSDPKLRHPRAFEEFMSALAARGMLDFSLEDGERVEPFFVTKKNGKLRLVVVCRRSNCHFTEAGGVSLCTGEGLSAIELGADEDIFVGGADLSDAFYHMGLPKPLRKYFTFRPVRAASVGCTEIGGRAVAAHEKVYPRLAVIPMGWSWALWMCQKIHERIVEADGSDPKFRITDKTCPPDLSQPCHTQYVDNYIAISTNRDNVKKSVSSAITALERSAEEAAPWMRGPDDTQEPARCDLDAGAPGDIYGFGRLPRADDFPEVPREMIEQDWRVVGRFEWRKKGESIPVLEARATLYGYRHLLRSRRNHGKRLVVLGDSMSVAGAVSKSRSGSRAMLHVTQSIAALSLATGPSLHYRWLPSEWNAADGPSRGRWRPTAPSALAPRDARARGPSARQRGGAGAAAADGTAGSRTPGGCGRSAGAGRAAAHGVGADLEPAYVVSMSPSAGSAAAASRAAATGRLSRPPGLGRAHAPQGEPASFAGCGSAVHSSAAAGYDGAGGGVHQAEDAGPLPGDLRRLPGVGERPSADDRGPCGPGDRGVAGRPLPRRRGPECRVPGACGGDFLHRPEQDVGRTDASVAPRPPGLSQARTTAISIADALHGSGDGGDGAPGPTALPECARRPSHLRAVPEARRGVPHQGGGPRPARGEGQRSVPLVRDSPCRRDREGVQDRRVRREPVSGSRPAVLHRARARPDADAPAGRGLAARRAEARRLRPAPGGDAVHRDARRGDEGLQGGRRNAGGGHRAGRRPHVHAAARRRLARLRLGLPPLGGRAPSRAPAFVVLGPALREGEQVGSSRSQARAGAPGPRQTLRRAAERGGVWPALSCTIRLRQRVFVEVFSGSGHLS